MRLTSEIFVSALVRRIAASGGFAAVLQRGNGEAGAIFLVLRRRDGTVALYGPAPQQAYDDNTSDRRFVLLADPVDPDALDTRLAREQRFDSDLWVVELEPGSAAIDEFVSVADLH